MRFQNLLHWPEATGIFPALPSSCSGLSMRVSLMWLSPEATVYRAGIKLEHSGVTDPGLC